VKKVVSTSGYNPSRHYSIMTKRLSTKIIGALSRRCLDGDAMAYTSCSDMIGMGDTFRISSRTDPKN